MKRLLSAKLNPTAEPSSRSTGPTSPVTTTCRPSQPLDLRQMELLSMQSAAVSHVRISPSRARALASLERAAAYGESTPALLANYDHATSSWRTSQHSLEGGLTEFSETWPRSGMTRNGTAYQLEPLVPHTFVTDSGLRPTPCASDWRGGCFEPRPYGDRRHWWARTYGMRYPSVTVTEAEMGFPPTWSELAPSATPSSRKSQKSSDARSSKRKAKTTDLDL